MVHSPKNFFFNLPQFDTLQNVVIKFTLPKLFMLWLSLNPHLPVNQYERKTTNKLINFNLYGKTIRNLIHYVYEYFMIYIHNCKIFNHWRIRCSNYNIILSVYRQLNNLLISFGNSRPCASPQKTKHILYLQLHKHCSINITLSLSTDQLRPKANQYWMATTKLQQLQQK